MKSFEYCYDEDNDKCYIHSVALEGQFIAYKMEFKVLSDDMRLGLKAQNE